jgi:hypothetical protein
MYSSGVPPHAMRQRGIEIEPETHWQLMSSSQLVFWELLRCWASGR